MPAPTSARAPVNRFPEDVDQFRLERRRETRERKRENGGEEKRERERERESASTRESKDALSPSRRARERTLQPPFGLFITAHPFFPLYRHPLYLSFSSYSARTPVSLLFRVAEKMRPSGRTLVASVVPRCRLHLLLPPPALSLSLSPLLSFSARILFISRLRAILPFAFFPLAGFAIKEIPHFSLRIPESKAKSKSRPLSAHARSVCVNKRAYPAHIPPLPLSVLLRSESGV